MNWRRSVLDKNVCIIYLDLAYWCYAWSTVTLKVDQPTSDSEPSWGLNVIGFKGEQTSITQRHSVQFEGVFLPVRADATVGFGLKLQTIPGPHAFYVSQVQSHLKGAALTFRHLHILQAFQHLQTVFW